jgi:hypothetical protein
LRSKFYAIVLIAALFLSVSLLGWGIYTFGAHPNTHPAFSSAAVVAHLQQCADLVTVRAPITTVIEQHEIGTVGSAKALLSVTAWLDVGCDLHSAKVVSTDTSAHTLRLLLPGPRVLAVRIDAERTRVYDLQRSGLWHLIPGSSIEENLVNHAIERSTSSLIDQPTTAAMVRLAQERIRTELQSLASGAGWTVEVDWQP